MNYYSQKDDIVSVCNSCGARFNGIGICPLCKKSDYKIVYKNGSFYK